MPTNTTARQAVIPYWVKAVIMFLIGWIFMYAVRNIFSASMVSLQQEFGFTATQLGSLSSIFFTTYTLTQVPFGWVGDKIGLKRILILCLLSFGVFTGLTGLCTTFSMFLLVRALVGVGEGAYYGPQYALSSEAIPLKWRGVGSAVCNCGMAFGTSLGLLGASYIMNRLGMKWNSVFYIFMFGPIIVAVLFKIILKEHAPQSGNAAAAAEAAVGPTDTAESRKIPINRSIVAIYIGVFCSLFGFFVIQTWLPYFLQTERGLESSQTAIIASVLAWFSIPGALLFARLSDRFKTRKKFMLLLFICALVAMIGCVYFESYSTMVVFLYMYGFTGKLAMDPLMISSIADNLPASCKNSGTIFSIFNFTGMSASIVAPYVAGWICDATGSLVTAFYLSGVMLAIGFLTILFVYRDNIK